MGAAAVVSRFFPPTLAAQIEYLAKVASECNVLQELSVLTPERLRVKCEVAGLYTATVLSPEEIEFREEKCSENAGKST